MFREQILSQGRAFAMDVGVYYENDDVEISGKEATVAWGVAITNIGNKISYTETSKSDFIPINLRFGPRVTLNLDDHNSLTASIRHQQTVGSDSTSLQERHKWSCYH